MKGAPGLSILLVGDTDRPEFRPCRGAIETTGRVIAAKNVESAIAALEDGRAVVDLIVVAQAYPGEFSTAAVDGLRGLAPLARMVAILGSWCEGESRSGNPFPGAVRVFWHEFPARCATEMARLSQGSCSAWALPATAGEEERLLAAPNPSAGRRQGLMAIHSPEFEMYDWLAAVFHRRGCATAWLRPGRAFLVQQASGGIFDGLEAQGEELDALRRFTAMLRPAPVLVLLQFPRVEDQDRVRAAGAAAVLSKPLLLEDLEWHLP